MKTIKKRFDKITLRAHSLCICGCKRLVILKDDEDGELVYVAKCFKCDIELEHASTLNSLKQKLKLLEE